MLDRAERSGQSLSRLYTSLGTFAVLAGILLLVNIFFMLADERKSELGMLRASASAAISLVGAFAAEGWCYAVLSAIAGTFVGLGLGRALMAAAAKLFSRRGDDSRIALHFAFKWASVQRGFVVGFVIAIATVVVTSIWLSRFNIIQAIRDITEPRRKPHRRSSYLGLGGAAVGLLLTGAGVASSSFLALMLGPVLVFVGVGPMLARNIPRPVVNTAIGARSCWHGRSPPCRSRSRSTCRSTCCCSSCRVSCSSEPRSCSPRSISRRSATASVGSPSDRWPSGSGSRTRWRDASARR